MSKTVFITGSSGFIGSNLAKRILTTEPDTKGIGLDNMKASHDNHSNQCNPNNAEYNHSRESGGKNK
mgnify:CR=1 FL=1